MKDDPIVEEVRRERAKLLQESGGTIAGLMARIREQEAQEPGSTISLEEWKRQQRLDEIQGMARGSGPAPTDEEVKRWIEEERVRKYG